MVLSIVRPIDRLRQWFTEKFCENKYIHNGSIYRTTNQSSETMIHWKVFVKINMSIMVQSIVRPIDPVRGDILKSFGKINTSIMALSIFHMDTLGHNRDLSKLLTVTIAYYWRNISDLTWRSIQQKNKNINETMTVRY